LIAFEDVEELILPGELLAEDDLVVVDEMLEIFGTPSFSNKNPSVSSSAC